MFGPIGGPELILILGMALLLFGPRKLPQIGRTIGKAMAEFRGATHEFKATLDREVALDDLRKVRGEINTVTREIGKAVNEVPASEAPAVERSVDVRDPQGEEDAGAGARNERSDSSTAVTTDAGSSQKRS